MKFIEKEVDLIYLKNAQFILLFLEHNSSKVKFVHGLRGWQGGSFSNE